MTMPAELEARIRALRGLGPDDPLDEDRPATPPASVKVHHALTLFPAMKDQDLHWLKLDIQAHGVREDITFWRRELIDGRARIRACQELGIDWRDHACDLDEDDPVRHTVCANLYRRHLNTTEWGLAALRLRGDVDRLGEGLDVERMTDGRTEFVIHPAAKLFPLLRGKQLEALIQDIRENGQREGALVWRGQLIDGRNQLLACKRLNEKLNCWILDDDCDPVQYLVSRNLFRRHLTPTQRATVAHNLREFYHYDPAAREYWDGRPTRKYRLKSHIRGE